MLVLLRATAGARDGTLHRAPSEEQSG